MATSTTDAAKIVGAGIAVIVVIAGLFYVSFAIKRWWNYSWGYEAKVTETVCMMVKPEHLTLDGKKKCD